MSFQGKQNRVWDVVGWLVLLVVVLSWRGVDVVVSQALADDDLGAADGQTSVAASAQSAGEDGTTQAATSQSAEVTTATSSSATMGSEKVVGWIEISGPLSEEPVPFAWMNEHKARPTLRRVLSQLRYVENQPSVLGVVIYLDDADLHLSQVNQLAAVIKEVRGKHKKVFVFAQAYDLQGYLLGCAADMILLQRKGSLEITGLHMEEMYLAGLLEKLGIRADMIQIGKFKGADEALTRVGPSAEWSQNMDRLLDDLYEQVVEEIGRGRGMDRATVVAMLGECLGMGDEDYVKNKLVDRLVDRDLADVTQEEFGDDFNWDEDLGLVSPMTTPAGNPFAVFQMLFQDVRPRIVRPTIALIHAQGAITSGESRYGNGPVYAGLMGSQSIGSKTMSQILDDVASQPMIKGVVIQLDSPGGSALASEVIWQAVRQMRETGEGHSSLPVYVAVGNMAASGGYYIACASDRIYVNSGSIVGSIGVVGGKMVLGGLYEKIGVQVYQRSRGPMGDVFNSAQPFNFRQRSAIENSMRRVYEQFVDRVQMGRGNRIKDYDAVTQGRIFTGKQALTLGMADRLGGVDDAITQMAEELKLEPGRYDVVDLPGPITLPEYLESIFGVRSSGAGLTTREEVVAGWSLLPASVRRQIGGVLMGMLLMEREPVLMIFPTVLLVK